MLGLAETFPPERRKFRLVGASFANKAELWYDYPILPFKRDARPGNLVLIRQEKAIV